MNIVFNRRDISKRITETLRKEEALFRVFEFLLPFVCLTVRIENSSGARPPVSVMVQLEIAAFVTQDLGRFRQEIFR